MTRLYKCDWCGDVCEDRDVVHPVEITHGADVINKDVCVSCFQGWDIK